ncbi:MAG: D-aminoacylase [Chloroflexi bacterium]|nr:D-aminoacylase [Chloroflexota bacterium]
MASILVRDGRVVDGTGNPWFHADVRIVDDRIVEIGRGLASRTGERVIDAKGRVVCPGFFDMHSHSEYPLLVDGDGQSKIRQGITTDVTGESTSAGPLYGLAREEAQRALRQFGIEPDWTTLAEYFRRIESQGIALNLVCYVGHSTVRQGVFGNEPRPPTERELSDMKRIVAQAMDEGAFGLSSSLSHPPGNYAETSEFVELCRVVAAKGGIYTRHLRDEGDGVLDALQEFIDVGEFSGCPIEVFHIKVAGEHNWRRLTPLVIEAVESARRRGVDITASQYPYEYGSAALANCMPYWSRQGGTGAMVERLRDPELRQRIRAEMDAGWPGSWFKETRGGWEGVVVSTVVTDQNRPHQGRTIAEIARLKGAEPVDVFFDLLIEEGGTVTSMFYWMAEDDIADLMRRPWVSICTDAAAVQPEGVLGRAHVHPRYYGAFPRLFGRYVRERGILTLEDAVRKATSLGALRLGIRDRGTLRPGAYADIVVFDEAGVADTATYEQPHAYPRGIDHVIVNGEVVIEDGEHTGARPGRVLRSYERI